MEEKELPERWVWTTLGDVCSKPQYGWTTKAKRDSGSTKLLRTTDISSRSIDWSTVPYCTEVPENLEDYKIYSGDIVISRAGSVGLSYLLTSVPFESVFASYLIRFRPLYEINRKFIAYYLQAPSYWAEVYEQSSGIALANINARKLENIPFPLAPLPEQQRIVEAIEQKFSCLDEGIALLRQAQKRLKLYRAAVLKAAVEGELTVKWRAAHPDLEPASELLGRILAERRARWEEELIAKGRDPKKAKYEEPSGPDVNGLSALPERWCWATAKQLASSAKHALTIGPFGSDLKVSDYREEGVPLIFVRNIRSGKFDGPQTKYITPTKAEELKAHQVVGGDILITKMGDPPGDSYLYPHSMVPAIITADGIKWTISPNLLRPQFFVDATNSFTVKKQILNMTTGVAQQKISLEKFEKIAFPFPPLAEQEQIVALIEERLSIINELETTIEKALQRAERQRQSILRQAFTGKLVPQNPEDEPASALLERIGQEHEQEKQKKQTREIRHQASKNKKPSSIAQITWPPDRPFEPIDSTDVAQESLWQEAEVAELSILVDSTENYSASGDKEKGCWPSAIIRSGTQK